MNGVNDLKTENIVGELNLILLNIPQNLELLEKIRWVYIKAGRLFSYDYRIVDNKDVAFKELDFEGNSVSRYQTCLQISYLFNLMLNYIDPNLKANVIERKLDLRGNRDVEHQANEIILPNGEKYILDLTLDLFLIQSGCQTKHFCYETDEFSTYDILPLCDIRNMDEKLGLITNGVYTDDKLKELRQLLNNHDFSNMSNNDIIDYKINMINSVLKQFNGYHEGMQFVNKLFIELLDMQYKEYHLTYKHNNSMELVACFIIMFKDVEKCIIYSNKLGLVSSTYDNIFNMLNNGWVSKSNSLKKIKNIKNK